MVPSSEERETLAQLLAQLRSFVESGQWGSARQEALAAAAAAEALNDIDGMIVAGEALERFNEFGIAGRLLAQVGRVIAKTVGTEWDGSDMPAGTLLVEQRIRDIGSPVRNARLIRLAGTRAGRCIVLINPRLVSLYRRSFPGIDIRAKGTADDEARKEADAVASFETLTQYLTPDSATVAAGFSPLRPDSDLVSRFRERYKPHGSSQPAIGVSWSSTNQAKDSPPLACWGRLFQDLPANYISLQYGDSAADLATFETFGVTPWSDPTVNSLGDLDVFAAQVASLDAVVTISNTTAHMAGALGIPTVVVLDDKFHLTWPVGGLYTPWYPRVGIVRKEGREWTQTFLDVRKRLAMMLTS
jgi:hypothetical protein